MEGDLPPAHFSEQEHRVALDMPEIIIERLEGSSNLANVKIAKDIAQVVGFARGEISYDSPERHGIRRIEETQERYLQDKKDNKEIPDREVLLLLNEARLKLGRGGIAAAIRFIEEINEILRRNPGLFYVVYDDGTEAPLSQIWRSIDDQTGRVEFYDNRHGESDDRRARAYMIDVSRLSAAARREIDDRI